MDCGGIPLRNFIRVCPGHPQISAHHRWEGEGEGQSYFSISIKERKINGKKESPLDFRCPAESWRSWHMLFKN